ncbi:MAG: 4Fe-4S double cluster binding domain-containing protein [Anaerofustis sp.]
MSESAISLTESLKNILHAQGAADTGMADITCLGIEHYPHAVSICVKLLDSVIDEIDTEPTQTYYAHYKAVNGLLNELSLRCAMHLEQQGWKAYPIAASLSTMQKEEYRANFPHKTAATLAGLGSIGKNGLFLHRQFGPRVRLATVLTDAPLSCGMPVTKSDCGSCDLCVKACPAGALHGINWTQKISREMIYDPRMCSDFMGAHFGQIGRGFVCGICMAVCPKGEQSKREGSNEIY